MAGTGRAATFPAWGGAPRPPPSDPERRGGHRWRRPRSRPPAFPAPSAPPSRSCSPDGAGRGGAMVVGILIVALVAVSVLLFVVSWAVWSAVAAAERSK